MLPNYSNLRDADGLGDFTDSDIASLLRVIERVLLGADSCTLLFSAVILQVPQSDRPLLQGDEAIQVIHPILVGCEHRAFPKQSLRVKPTDTIGIIPRFLHIRHLVSTFGFFVHERDLVDGGCLCS